MNMLSVDFKSAMYRIYMAIVLCILSLHVNSKTIEGLTYNDEGYYEISSVNDLILLSNYTDQGNSCRDLKFKVTTQTLDFADINFTPIIQFEGSFDGAGVIIKNLKSSGVFIQNRGTIQGITLDSSCVISGDSEIGSIAGTNLGVITDCTNHGIVMGYMNVGGIVGHNDGSIDKCVNTGEIIGTDFYGVLGQSVGGIAGANYAKGSVVSNCNNYGNVTGSLYVGGIIGSNSRLVEGCRVANCTIKGVVGEAQLMGEIGAVVGKEGVLKNNFYYHTVIVMIGDEVFDNLMERGVGQYGYSPFDKLGDAGAVLTYDFQDTLEVDQDGAYLIKDLNDLSKFTEIVNIGYRCKGQTFKVVCNELDFEDVGYTIIGNSTSRGFGGVFDGQQVLVKNLTINEAKTDTIGMFGLVTGVIKNIVIGSSCSFKGHDNVGGIAGCLNGSMENCTSKALVEGNNNVGGFAGFARGNFIGCTSEAKVEGVDYIGGFAGQVSCPSSKALECENMGTVHGNENVGGLFGYVYNKSYTSYDDDMTLVDCHNSGEVIGKEYVGGIIGRTYNIASHKFVGIERCSNKGTVQGKNVMGGIVGSLSQTIIKNCTNSGLVTITESGSRIGGIVGVIASSEMESCNNTGLISAGASLSSGFSQYVGGIAGQTTTSEIRYCNNSNTVSGYAIVGGIAGDNGCYITECYNEGTIEGVTNSRGDYGSYVGGIAGDNGGSIKGSLNVGLVNGSFKIGGISGENTGYLNNNICDNCVVSGNNYVGAIIGNIKDYYEKNVSENYYYLGTIVKYGTQEFKESTSRGVGGNTSESLRDISEKNGAVLSYERIDTGINGLVYTEDKNDHCEWYDLMGRKVTSMGVNGKPGKRGLYIYQGRKVVIR